MLCGMQARDLLVDPFEPGWGRARGACSPVDAQPLGVLDLRACPVDARLSELPPFPLIGFGNPGHPIAGALDAVIESPVSLDALIRHVQHAPRAAALTVQLLRSLEGVPVERALQLESMCYGLLQGSAEHAAWLATRVVESNDTPTGQLIVERSGSVLHLVIDRPAARNAIDRVLRDQLCDAFTVAALDTQVRSIQLRASGQHFSIGGDLKEFGTTRDPATAHLIRSRTLPALALVPRADILEVHVQGACIGAGVELAAFAGRVTATSNAWFQLPELAMGLIPGAGGCVSVPKRIGRQRTALMILSGRRINAATALRWGLIDAIED